MFRELTDDEYLAIVMGPIGVSASSISKFPPITDMKWFVSYKTTDGTTPSGKEWFYCSFDSNSIRLFYLVTESHLSQVPIKIVGHLMNGTLSVPVPVSYGSNTVWGAWE